MLRSLLRFLGKKERVTRLERNQVLEIARRAAKNYPEAAHLMDARLDADSPRPTWIVSSATRGSSVVVTIDDETGAVLDVTRHGGR